MLAGCFLLRSFPSACRWPSSHCVFTWSSFSSWLCLFLLFLEGHLSYWIRSQPNNLILTFYLLNNSVSKYIHILKDWGISTPTHKIWWETYSVHLAPHILEEQEYTSNWESVDRGPWQSECVQFLWKMQASKCSKMARFPPRHHVDLAQCCRLPTPPGPTSYTAGHCLPSEKMLNKALASPVNRPSYCSHLFLSKDRMESVHSWHGLPILGLWNKHKPQLKAIFKNQYILH